MDFENKIIWTGLRFFNRRIYLESSGDAEVDNALKLVFKDDYCRTAPLTMTRADVQLCLHHQREAEHGIPVKELSAGQGSLF